MWLHVPMWVLEEAEDARNATAEGTTAEGRSMDAEPGVMETSRPEGESRAARATREPRFPRARASAPQDAGPSVMERERETAGAGRVMPAAGQKENVGTWETSRQEGGSRAARATREPRFPRARASAPQDAGPSVMEREGGSRAARAMREPRFPRARASAPQDAGPSVMKGKTASGAASPCAPGPEDSNWVCLSPYRDIALFVGSSETPTPRPLSWPGWKKRPWMTRLCGPTLPPSTVARGVARWISSLPDGPVSPSACPASAGEAPTNATCGPTCGACSSKPGRPCSLPKTCPVTSPSASTSCAPTFKTWVTTWKRASSARRKPALHTSGDASSFWPTPTVSQSGSWPDIFLKEGRLTFADGKHQAGIAAAAKAWTALYLMGMGRARAAFLPDRMRLTPGNVCLPHNLVCNPRFLEHLMGWPTDWTATDSSATGFVLWRRRMRWRFWRLLVCPIVSLPSRPHPPTDRADDG